VQELHWDDRDCEVQFCKWFQSQRIQAGNMFRDRWFTVSGMEHHLISLARCETGRIKFFLGNGLCKGTKRITAKIPGHYITRSLVYHTQPRNITGLQENIYAATTDITTQTLGGMWYRSMQHCINLRKQQKEHQF